MGTTVHTTIPGAVINIDLISTLIDYYWLLAAQIAHCPIINYIQRWHSAAGDAFLSAFPRQKQRTD